MILLADRSTSTVPVCSVLLEVRGGSVLERLRLLRVGRLVGAGVGARGRGRGLVRAGVQVQR